MTDNAPLRILEISASAKQDGSISRTLSNDLIAALEDRRGTDTEISLRLVAGMVVILLGTAMAIGLFRWKSDAVRS